MRNRLLPVLILFLLVVDLDAQRRRRGSRDDNRKVELKNFTFRRLSFTAESLDGKDATFGIYLPAGYDDKANAQRTYPFAIWLHGFNGSYSRFNTGGGAKVLDRLAGEKKIPLMIFVTLSASRRSVYVNGESFGNTEDLVVKDLIAQLEKEFRVGKSREHRAIMGISMGGMGALKMAWKYPEVFGQVATHSSAILPADPTNLPPRYERLAASPRMGLDVVFGNPIDPVKWKAEMPMAIASTIDTKKLSGQRIYFDAGTRDRYGFADSNVDLHELLEKRKIAHSFDLIENGGHSWGSANIVDAVANSLQFIGSGFAEASAKPKQGDEKKGDGKQGDGKKGDEKGGKKPVEAGK